MLEIKEYKSGARSLEFLCSHLRTQAGDLVPRRSHLPGHQLLEMHVDAKAFWAICERNREFSTVVEKVAQQLNANYQKHESGTTKSAEDLWGELNLDLKSSNLAQAARIPTVLALANMKAVLGSPLSQPDETTVRNMLHKKAGVLAEAEHNLWMVERMLAGWQYKRIEKKDTEHKFHPLLIPYAQLPRKEQLKDDRVILGKTLGKEKNNVETPDYIELLKGVGFRIEIA